MSDRMTAEIAIGGPIPSALVDDDRKGKPGANRGRKATGLGASTHSS